MAVMSSADHVPSLTVGPARGGLGFRLRRAGCWNGCTHLFLSTSFLKVMRGVGRARPATCVPYHDEAINLSSTDGHREPLPQQKKAKARARSSR